MDITDKDFQERFKDFDKVLQEYENTLQTLPDQSTIDEDIKHLLSDESLNLNSKYHDIQACWNLIYSLVDYIKKLKEQNG